MGDAAEDPTAVTMSIVHFDVPQPPGAPPSGQTFTESFECPNRYKIDESMKGLGAGAFGFVTAADDTKQGGKSVAIKKLKDVFNKFDPIKTKSTMREIKLLQHFSKDCNSETGHHPNLMRVIDIFTSVGNPATIQKDELATRLSNFDDVYLVLERWDMSLKQLLGTGTVLGEAQRCYIMFQILRGMKAIFSASVMHRDMKPENVLVNTEDSTCCICDFGAGRGVATAGDSSVTVATFTTTQWYRPPEAFLDDLARGGAGGAESGLNPDGSVPQAVQQSIQALDLWSCGAILCEMMQGKPIAAAPGNDVLGQLRIIFTTIAPLTEEILAPLNLQPHMKQAVAPIMQAGTKATLNNVFKGKKDPGSEDGDDYAEEEINLAIGLMKIAPLERTGIDDALKDEYFNQYDLNEENHGPAVTAKPFTFRWQDCEKTPRKAMFGDICVWNPTFEPKMKEHLGGDIPEFVTS